MRSLGDTKPRLNAIDNDSRSVRKVSELRMEATLRQVVFSPLKADPIAETSSESRLRNTKSGPYSRGAISHFRRDQVLTVWAIAKRAT